MKTAVKKRTASRSGSRAAPKKRATSDAEKPVGVVTHFYGKIGVAIAKFGKPIPVGTMLRFRGATTDFTLAVASMQYDHVVVRAAKKGQEVGIHVGERVREGDLIYKV